MKGRDKVSNLLKKDKGFTLIEVVLVLAIAGLILVIVFLALQGAQKSRRDTARKTAAGQALAGLESCASNGANNGNYTTPVDCTATLISGGYFSGTDPKGVAYTVVGATPTVAGQLWPQAATCTGAASGTASVTIYQEAGAAYCVHN